MLTWPQILWDLAVGDRAPGTTWGRQQREPVADKLTPAFKGTFCFLIYTVSKQYYIGIGEELGQMWDALNAKDAEYATLKKSLKELQENVIHLVRHLGSPQQSAVADSVLIALQTLLSSGSEPAITAAVPVAPTQTAQMNEQAEGAQPSAAALPGPPSAGGLRAMSAKDVLSTLEAFSGNANANQQVLDAEYFLPFQLWFDGCIWKLKVAGIPTHMHARLICQKLQGAALAAFQTRCLAENWDLADCSLDVLRKRLAALFPNAEHKLTSKLTTMTFRAKHLVQDLITFRHCARFSSFAQMLDRNEFLYTLVRTKMHGAKHNCLLTVQSEHGLHLDKADSFERYIDTAILIAEKVQASVYEPTSGGGGASGDAPPAGGGGQSSKTSKRQRDAAASGGANRTQTAAPRATDPPAMKAARSKLQSGDHAAWRKQQATITDDSELCRAVGICPDCAFCPVVNMNLVGHDCHAHKKAARMPHLRAALDAGDAYQPGRGRAAVPSA